MLKVEPDIESRDGRDLDLESELLESLEHVIALVLEVLLKSDLLLHDTIGVEKRYGGKLEAIYEVKHLSCGGSERLDVRVVSTSVEEGTRLRQSSDEVLGAKDPANTPTRETPVLSKESAR